MLTVSGKLAIAAGGFAALTLPHIAVFTNDIDPVETSIWTDFDIAAYTGYASPATAIGAVFAPHSGGVAAPVADAIFLGPTAGPGVDGYGWLLFDNVTHDVWACGRFDNAPAFLQSILARLEVDVVLNLDGDTTVEVEN